MVVLDASVILKWFYPARTEPGADVAREFRERFLDGHLTIVVPCFAMYECASSMRHSQYRLPPSTVKEHVRDLWGLGLTVVRVTRRLLWTATEVSFVHGGSVYDAYYFATAQFSQCPCVTADRRAHRHVKSIPWIHLLRDVSDVSAFDD